MMLLAFAIHIIPDDWADRFIEKTKRLPLCNLPASVFGFVAVYAYFKSAEPVMPIYLQFNLIQTCCTHSAKLVKTNPPLSGNLQI